MTCPRCGQELRGGGSACDGCGWSASPAETAEAPAAAPEPAPEAAARVGKIIGGKYQILSLLGEGGMGCVYRARRLHIGDEVAVKLLHRKYVEEEKAVERFRREAQAAARIRHPAVVAIYDFSEAGADESAYIVMELVEGRTLRKLLEREGPLGPGRAAAVLREICRGVGAAHQLGIVHRDIKPDNVMILPADADEQREHVKVVDFGIAKLRDLAAAKTLTQTGSVVGTVYYMSPEQCCGEHLDPRSDVYSLGVVLYEMLAGTPPFTAETGTAIVAKHLSQPPPPLPEGAGVPAELEAVLMRALAKEPGSRPEDALALGRELRAAVGGTPAPTTAESLSGVGAVKGQTGEAASKDAAGARGGRGRMPRRWVAAAAVAAALLAAVAFIFSRGPRVERRPETPTPAAPAAAPPECWQVRAALKSDSKVYAVAFSPDGQLLATASSEGLREGAEFISEVRLWNPATGELKKTLTERSEGVLSVAFAPDGRALAAVTGAGSGSAKLGKVKLWDAQTGELKWAVNGHTDFGTSVAYSPDGRLLASGSLDRTVKLWDAQTGRLHKSLPPREGRVNGVAFSPDGRLLAVASQKALELWDVGRAELERALSGNRYAPVAVAFSPDGRLLAGGDVGGEVGLWEVAGGTLRQTLAGHGDIVVAVAFAPGGGTLASGGYDSTVVVWDVQTASKLATLREADRVTAVAFSPDGRSFASGGWGREVRLWW